MSWGTEHYSPARAKAAQDHRPCPPALSSHRHRCHACMPGADNIIPRFGTSRIWIRAIQGAKNSGFWAVQRNHVSLPVSQGLDRRLRRSGAWSPACSDTNARDTIASMLSLREHRGPSHRPPIRGMRALYNSALPWCVARARPEVPAARDGGGERNRREPRPRPPRTSRPDSSGSRACRDERGGGVAIREGSEPRANQRRLPRMRACFCRNNKLCTTPTRDDRP